MSFDVMSAITRLMAALVLAVSVAGCGSGASGQFASNLEQKSQNKLATKILADIAVQRVRGAMPTRVARKRGAETL